MKVFRKFDYFRKSTSPEAIKSTFIGGLVSITCMVTLSILIMNEIKILYTPEIKKNTTVSTDPNKHPHIALNLDINFPNVPCYLVSLELKTSVNEMSMAEINKYLVWSHVDKDMIPIEISEYKER